MTRRTVPGLGLTEHDAHDKAIVETLFSVATLRTYTVRILPQEKSLPDPGAGRDPGDADDVAIRHVRRLGCAGSRTPLDEGVSLADVW
jgi:hypothetical protein